METGIYTVYFQEDGALKASDNLTWYQLTDKKGYDKDKNKITELPYVYWDEKIDTGETTPPAKEDKTDIIGLFINNKISLDSTEENITTNSYEANTYTDKRIFSCIGIKPQGESEEVLNKSNIFSILKNGNLFIGGDILYADGSTTQDTEINAIPDIISIVNSKIMMTNDGQVSMDFDKFVDMEGKSLTKTIESAVNSIRLPRHSHQYDLWIEVETVNPKLEDITYRISSGSPDIHINERDKASITEYLNTHYVFSKSDFIDRIEHDPALSTLSMRTNPSMSINTGTVSSDKIPRKIPVMGEIKEAGSGESGPGLGGPYLYDPIIS